MLDSQKSTDKQIQIIEEDPYQDSQARRGTGGVNHTSSALSPNVLKDSQMEASSSGNVVKYWQSTISEDIKVVSKQKKGSSMKKVEQMKMYDTSERKKQKPRWWDDDNTQSNISGSMMQSKEQSDVESSLPLGLGKSRVSASVGNYDMMSSVSRNKKSTVSSEVYLADSDARSGGQRRMQASFNTRYSGMYEQNEDIVEALHKEREDMEATASKRMFQYRIFIYTLACIRLFMVSLCSVTNQEVRVTHYGAEKQKSRMTFVLGYLLFGNLTDNAYDPKWLLIICEFNTGLQYFLAALACFTDDDDKVDVNYLSQVLVGTMFFQAGIEVITIVHLFNWFPTKWFGTVLTSWYLWGPIAFYCQFALHGNWKYFPNPPTFSTDDEDLAGKLRFIHISYWRMLFLGLLLFVLTIVEYYTFVFYPLQVGLTKMEKKTEQPSNYRSSMQSDDLDLISPRPVMSTSEYTRLAPDDVKEMYFYMYKTKSTLWRSEKQTVSFLTVLQEKEVQGLIICGVLRSFADYLSFELIGATSKALFFLNDPDDTHNFCEYFFGSCLGLFTVGVFHDRLFQQNSYITMVVINIGSIVFQVISLLQINKPQDEYNSKSLLMYGFFSMYVNFLLVVLIPFQIAQKTRYTDEITTAGTVIGCVSLSYFIPVVLASSIVSTYEKLNEQSEQSEQTDDKTLNYYWVRAAFIVLVILSTWPIWEFAKIEWANRQPFKCFCSCSYCCGLCKKKSRRSRIKEWETKEQLKEEIDEIGHTVIIRKFSSSDMTSGVGEMSSSGDSQDNVALIRETDGEGYIVGNGLRLDIEEQDVSEKLGKRELNPEDRITNSQRRRNNTEQPRQSRDVPNQRYLGGSGSNQAQLSLQNSSTLESNPRQSSEQL